MRMPLFSVPVVNVPGWYDVDDSETLQLLKAEIAGKSPPFAKPGIQGADAPATRRFLAGRLATVAVEASW
jgi:hypothetical protein